MPRGNNQDSISEQNRSLVISLIKQNGVCSRTDLSRQTGLKPATITNIVGELFEWGLIKESNNTTTRRSIGLELCSDAFFVLGVNINRARYHVGLFNLAGELLEDHTNDIHSGLTSEDVMEAILTRCDELILRHPRILVIGISLPGPMSKSEGRIIFMSGFPGWERIDILDTFQKRYSVPVTLDHDANAGVLAEKWFGRYNADTMVSLTLGPGIGCGVISKDRLFEGAYGMAGEVGHMSICYDGPRCGCGNRGCLELYCSSTQFRRNIVNNLDRFPNTMLRHGQSMEQISAALRQGDELAVKVFNEMADRLSVGVVNMINAYNPNLIILGDEMSVLGQPLLDAIRERTRESVLPKVYEDLQITLSSFKVELGYIGACALGVEYIIKRPNDIRQKALHLA